MLFFEANVNTGFILLRDMKVYDCSSLKFQYSAIIVKNEESEVGSLF